MLFLAANAIGESHLNIGEAGLYALLGYAVVFLGLVLLMIVVFSIGKIFIAKEKRSAKTAASVEEVVEEVPQPLAPGAAGQLKLYDVEPKTAAMIMAIVADKMGKPLNELRFISIREVK